jgi:Ca2+-binding EF-hand superfamily protein
MSMNKYLTMLLALGLSGSVIGAEPPAKAERGAQPCKDKKQHFQRFDLDKNGAISREEAKPHPRMEKDFEAMDANTDGQVTEAEYRDYAKARMEQYREKVKTEMKARWDKADTNGDGALSREEAKASPQIAKHFDAMDADKNGQVSEQEVADYMKSHRPRGRTNLPWIRPAVG